MRKPGTAVPGQLAARPESRRHGTMAHKYQNILIHLVFSTKERRGLIPMQLHALLWKYPEPPLGKFAGLGSLLANAFATSRLAASNFTSLVETRLAEKNQIFQASRSDLSSEKTRTTTR
jgi:hypothetical protein